MEDSKILEGDYSDEDNSDGTSESKTGIIDESQNIPAIDVGYPSSEENSESTGEDRTLEISMIAPGALRSTPSGIIRSIIRSINRNKTQTINSTNLENCEHDDGTSDSQTQVKVLDDTPVKQVATAVSTATKPIDCSDKPVSETGIDVGSTMNIRPQNIGLLHANSRGNTEYVDPEETEILKPVYIPQRSIDLDVECGDIDSFPSNIDSSNEFIILQPMSDRVIKPQLDCQIPSVPDDETVNIVKSPLDGQISFVSDGDTDKIVESPQDGQNSSKPDYDKDRIVESPFDDRISNIPSEVDLPNFKHGSIQHSAMTLEEKRKLLQKSFSIVVEEIDPLRILLYLSNTKPHLKQLYSTLTEIDFRKKRAIRLLLEILVHNEDCIPRFWDAVKHEHEYCYKKIISNKALPSSNNSSGHQICTGCSKKAFNEFLSHCTSIPVELLIELLQEDMIDSEELLELHKSSDNQQQLSRFKNILVSRDISWVKFTKLVPQIPEADATQVARIIEKVDILCCRDCETSYKLSKTESQTRKESSTHKMLSIDMRKYISNSSLPSTIAVVTLDTDSSKEQEEEIVKTILRRKEIINATIKEYGQIKTAWFGSVEIVLELSNRNGKKVDYEDCISKIVWKILNDQEIKQNLENNELDVKVSVSGMDTTEQVLFAKKSAIAFNFTYLKKELFIASFKKLFIDQGIMTEEVFQTGFKIGDEPRDKSAELFLDYIIQSQSDIVDAFLKVINEDVSYKSLSKKMNDCIFKAQQDLLKYNVVRAHDEKEQHFEVQKGDKTPNFEGISDSHSTKCCHKDKATEKLPNLHTLSDNTTNFEGISESHSSKHCHKDESMGKLLNLHYLSENTPTFEGSSNPDSSKRRRKDESVRKLPNLHNLSDSTPNFKESLDCHSSKRPHNLFDNKHNCEGSSDFHSSKRARKDETMKKLPSSSHNRPDKTPNCERSSDSHSMDETVEKVPDDVTGLCNSDGSACNCNGISDQAVLQIVNRGVEEFDSISDNEHDEWENISHCNETKDSHTNEIDRNGNAVSKVFMLDDLEQPYPLNSNTQYSYGSSMQQHRCRPFRCTPNVIVKKKYEFNFTKNITSKPVVHKTKAKYLQTGTNYVINNPAKDEDEENEDY